MLGFFRSTRSKTARNAPIGRKRSAASRTGGSDGLVSRTLGRNDLRINFGARMHALLAADNAKLYRHVLERDNWTCCKCGIHLPEFMEIQHIDDNHANNREANLAAICRYCHDGEHPVWAASRQRYDLILCPELSQASLNRLAWAVTLMLARDRATEDMPQEEREELGIEGNRQHASIMGRQAETILQFVQARKDELANIIGGTHPEAFWEALFTDRLMEPPEKMQEIEAILDRTVRTFPNAARFDGTFGIPPSGRLSVWRDGRFNDITEDVMELSRSEVVSIRRSEALADTIQKIRGQHDA